MRKNIIIMSHNLHAFLQNEIKYAAAIFERVVVICPQKREFEKSVLGLPNVEVFSYNKRRLYLNALLSIPKIFEKEKRIEIVDSIEKRIFTKEYLKRFFNFLSLARILNKLLSKKLNLSINESREWVFYSAWYYATAFAVTEAKKKYLYAKTVSLAHSFEIDPIKNRFILGLFRRFYHNRLDMISFISFNVFSNYKENVAKDLQLSLNTTEVRYLGTRKLIEDVAHTSLDGILRIVSCSNVTTVKRIDMIFHALECIEGIPIIWTHIGSGSQTGYLKELIKNKRKRELSVIFMGAMENSKIHEYYTNNCIDLFINVSASEGIPISIMEAIAYGIPVVATDVGGNSEIINESFGKIISSNPTCDEIKNAILSIFNLSDKEKEQMKKNAMNFFSTHFNSDLIRYNFFHKLNEC